jgi:D-glycero-alpha-D-manno-heptose-7-phosphate kinase
MIITRTPFRVTLGGGGTDLPSYYEKHGGFIFAMGLNKYMYVCVNRPIADTKVRLHYTQAEEVEHASQLKHELAREALLRHGFVDRMEISSLADIPAGTGVGSSSCYLVGLLTALRAAKRDYAPLQDVAEEACDIELNVLKKGIGKQDQYMATFGGLTVLDIAKDGTVTVREVALGESALADLIGNTHIYYTGQRRDTVEVLDEQNKAMKAAAPAAGGNTVQDSLTAIKDLGYKILDQIQSQNFDDFGQSLHEHWMNKRRLSNKISNSSWDALYDEVRSDYSVLGGKIIGAGGGGFLMLYCAKNPAKLEKYMADRNMPRVHYGVDFEGSKVVANIVQR